MPPLTAEVVRAGVGAAAGELVVPGAAELEVGPVAPVDAVGPRTPRDPVVPVTAREEVVARASAQTIPAAHPLDLVVAVACDDHVGTLGALEMVGSIRPRDRRLPSEAGPFRTGDDRIQSRTETTIAASTTRPTIPRACPFSDP